MNESILHPDEKERVNAQLVRALVGTTWGCVVVHKIITVLCLVTPKRMGTNSSKINDTGISTLKQAYSRQNSGTVKLSS